MSASGCLLVRKNLSTLFAYRRWDTSLWWVGVTAIVPLLIGAASAPGIHFMPAPTCFTQSPSPACFLQLQAGDEHPSSLGLHLLLSIQNSLRTLQSTRLTPGVCVGGGGIVRGEYGR